MRTIHHAVTLDYYDGPILFEARDRIGGNYLAVAGDSAGGDPVYAVVGISPERLWDFRNGMVDLHDVMLEEGSDEWFLATPNWETDEFELEPQEEHLVESGYLPAEGYRLDSAASSDVAVLDAAQRRDNLVIELKAEPRESMNGHRMHLNSLVELLDLMQKLVGHAYRTARKESHDRRYAAMPVEEAVLMDVVVPAMAGSFCMLLEAGSGAQAGERELARSLRRVDLLFENVGSKGNRSTVSHLKETGGHLAATYVKLVNFLAKEEVGFHYTWAEPTFSRARRQSISAAHARRLSHRIAKLVERKTDEVTLEGRLVRADLKTGQWRLESRKRTYIGNVADDDCSQLNGLVVGNRYRFWCTEVVEKEGATGKTARKLYLDRMEGV